MNKDNKTLLIFILGFISSMAILPSKLVLKGNNELADLQSETQEHDIYAIGFDYPTHEETDGYYDE